MLDAGSTTIVLFFIVCFIRLGKGQFPAFGDVHDFRLTTDINFPSEGDDVTLRCMRTQPYMQKASSDFFGRNDGISWEQNDKPVYETSRGVDGTCDVTIDGRGIGRQEHGQSRDAQCEDDGVTVTLTLRSWTPSHVAGDVWRCLRFPFADSARLDVQSFVPATSVSITQRITKKSATYPPRGDYPRAPAGTVVSCVTSPCRPPASVEWFIASPEEGDVKLTSHAEIEQQVNTSRLGLSSTTSDVTLDLDTDHGLTVFCRASNERDQSQGQRRGGVTSDILGVVIKYPPSVRVTIEPSSSVREGDDVTLVCSADGRPTPKIQWLRKPPKVPGIDASLTEEEQVISVTEFVTLTALDVVDSGEYRCVATNGLEPDADGTVVLYVRERPRPKDVTSSDSGSADTPSNKDDGFNTGTVVGGLFATLLVVACICLVLFLFVRHRRGKRNIGSSSQDIHLDDSDTGIYASCASLPRAPPPPPYTEVDRRNRKLSKVENPGYGRSSSLIFGVDARRESNDGRPLPQPPDVYERYEEIDTMAVPGAYANDTSPYIEILDGDGYETPIDGFETPVSPSNNFDIPMTKQTKPSRSLTTRASPSNRTDGTMSTSTHPFRSQDTHNKSRAKTMLARPLRHYTNNKMARRAHGSDGSVPPRIDRRRFGTTVAPDIHYINNDFIDTQM